MLMFSTFEHSVDFLYTKVLQRPKEDCSRVQQLGVTCAAGYMSGVTGTFISNPADNLITAINNEKGLSTLQVRPHSGIVLILPISNHFSVYFHVLEHNQ
jgi:solute carrier family 25 phosphate transporter 3